MVRNINNKSKSNININIKKQQNLAIVTINSIFVTHNFQTIPTSKTNPIIPT